VISGFARRGTSHISGTGLELLAIFWRIKSCPKASYHGLYPSRLCERGGKTLLEGFASLGPSSPLHRRQAVQTDVRIFKILCLFNPKRKNGPLRRRFS
jgi:hypothetical protein